MKLKIKIVSLVIALLAAVAGLPFAACGNDVVAAAWVTLETDGGYVVYTTHMNGGYDHIIYYASQEDAAKAADNSVFGNFDIIKISFYPRILGPELGKSVTVVDNSQKWYEMHVTVNKKHELYSAEKAIYLNGERLVSDNTYDSEYITSWTFRDFTLVRGNPNGKINGFINVIEYK